MSYHRYALDKSPETFEGRLKVLDIAVLNEREHGRRINSSISNFILGAGILLHEETAKKLDENGFACHVVEAYNGIA